MPDRARVPGRTSLPAIVAWTLLVGLVERGPAVHRGRRTGGRRGTITARAGALHVGHGGPGIGLGLLRPQCIVGRLRQVPDHALQLAGVGRPVPGDGRADQTPWNQEKVAYGKLRDLYGWLGSWKRVAYWWLTGRTDRSERRWSGYARGYVNNIMQLRRQAPPGAGKMPVRTSSRSERGDWRRAAVDQRLRLDAGRQALAQGRAGPGRPGRVGPSGGHDQAPRVRWIAVTTQDGRFGWLPQARSLPAERPSRGRAWRDIRDRGGACRGIGSAPRTPAASLSSGQPGRAIRSRVIR